jgi:hypothetical protein
MTIRPVYDFGTLETAGVLSSDELNAFKAQTLGTVERLRTALGPTVVLEATSPLPRSVGKDDVLLWLAPSEEDVLAAAPEFDAETRARTILFDYAGENPLGLLERSGVAGLVTSSAVQSWESERPKRLHKMGQGHGLYGLKRLFDRASFDPIFLGVMSSEHYCIYYNDEVHELDQLLKMYVERLLLTSFAAQR